MKRIILFILLLGFFTSGFTQITRGEFFWDSDPGVGNATALNAEDGTFDNQLETMVHQSIPSLAEGIHVLHVRIKDNTNIWSPVFKTLVRVDKTFDEVKSHISTAEYFIDTDPGKGNGIAMVAFDGDYNDALEIALLPMINTVPVGMHVLGVRVKDANNNWSPAFKTTFKADGYFTNLKMPEIKAAEYFINTDPGEGNGLAMVAFDGDYNDALEIALLPMINTVPAGMHVLGVRVKDANNNWSPAFKTTFKADGYFVNWKASRIQTAEFYIDNDPGEGNGIPGLAFDGDLNDAFEAIQFKLSDIGDGLHKIGVRVQDADNHWSRAFETVFLAEACPEISISGVSDTTICAGQSLEITAPSGFSRYVWSHGDSTMTATINKHGSYTLTVTDSVGCSGYKEFAVHPNGPQGDWDYAKEFNSEKNYMFQTADYRGNIYLGAVYSNAADSLSYENETLNSTSAGGEIIVVKLNNAYQKQWMKKISLPFEAIPAQKMAVDDDGNMYFGGKFTTSFTYNGSTRGPNGYFVVKTDSLANIAWISTGGYSAASKDFIVDIKVKNNNLYILGRNNQTGNINFGGVYKNISVAGSFVAELSKYSGTPSWISTIGMDYFTDKLIIDDNNQVIVTGSVFNANLSVNGITLSNINPLSRSTNYLIKFDQNGTYQWSKFVRNTGGSILALTTNNSGDITILGQYGAYTGSVYIDNVLLTVTEQDSAKVYVARFTSGGLLAKHKTFISKHQNLWSINSISNNRYMVGGLINAYDVLLYGSDTIRLKNDNIIQTFFGYLNEDLKPVSASLLDGSFFNFSSNDIGNGKLCFVGTTQPDKIGFGRYKIDSKNFNSAIAVFDLSKLLPWETIKLANDTAICEGREITLSVPDQLSQYEWSNGSHDRSITLKQSSEIYLKKTESHGCPVQSETFRLTVNPLPQPRLGNDTILAPDRFLVLFPGLFNSYLWHDNKTTMMNTIGLDVHTGTHTAWVKVTNEFGCENTDSITITFSTVDVNDIGNNTIYVYPVPARDFINISSTLQIDFVEIYDMSGRLMIKEEIHGEMTSRIDLGNFVPGNYLVKVFKRNAMIKTFKFSKE